jgi:anti-anti-sigma factor
VASAVPVIVLPEEVGLDGAAWVAREASAALGAGGNRLVVDLARVKFLGSGGLGELVKLGKRLREAGGGVALARARPRIAKLLVLVGLDGVLRAWPTVEEAAASLA